jgi:hypothetical protein
MEKKMFEELFSDCCDAKPKGNVEKILDSYICEVIGICSCCNSLVTFYDDESYGEDWDDELEYMKEHIDE